MPIEQKDPNTGVSIFVPTEEERILLGKKKEVYDNFGSISKKISYKIGEMEYIAHRGFSWIAPENTMPAYRMATKYGFDSWECDVQISADGIPVVIHDSTVNRTTNGTGEVKAKTLAELQLLDASKLQPYFDGTRIPTFKEFLEGARGNSKNIYFEIKGYRSTADITLMVNEVVKAGWQYNSVAQSFIPTDLTTLRNINKDIALGFLVGDLNSFNNTLNNYAKNDTNSVMLVNQSVVLANPSIVQSARDLGVDVGVWTTDEVYNYVRLKSIGITKIMSNRLKESR